VLTQTTAYSHYQNNAHNNDENHGRAECSHQRWPPLQRGNVSQSNLQVLNGIPYVVEEGWKWRGAPQLAATIADVSKEAGVSPASMLSSMYWEKSKTTRGNSLSNSR
jgi:hypothetical protein